MTLVSHKAGTKTKQEKYRKNKINTEFNFKKTSTNRAK